MENIDIQIDQYIDTKIRDINKENIQINQIILIIILLILVFYIMYKKFKF